VSPSRILRLRSIEVPFVLFAGHKGRADQASGGLKPFRVPLGVRDSQLADHSFSCSLTISDSSGVSLQARTWETPQEHYNSSGPASPVGYREACFARFLLSHTSMPRSLLRGCLLKSYTGRRHRGIRAFPEKVSSKCLDPPAPAEGSPQQAAPLATGNLTLAVSWSRQELPPPLAASIPGPGRRAGLRPAKAAKPVGRLRRG